MEDSGFATVLGAQRGGRVDWLSLTADDIGSKTLRSTEFDDFFADGAFEEAWELLVAHRGLVPDTSEYWNHSSKPKTSEPDSPPLLVELRDQLIRCLAADVLAAELDRITPAARNLGLTDRQPRVWQHDSTLHFWPDHENHVSGAAAQWELGMDYIAFGCGLEVSIVNATPHEDDTSDLQACAACAAVAEDDFDVDMTATKLRLADELLVGADDLDRLQSDMEDEVMRKLPEMLKAGLAGFEQLRARLVEHARGGLKHRLTTSYENSVMEERLLRCLGPETFVSLRDQARADGHSYLWSIFTEKDRRRQLADELADTPVVAGQTTAERMTERINRRLGRKSFELEPPDGS